MDENKDVQQTEQQDKQPAPLSEARKTALLRYMAVLFAVAFLLVLLSLILQASFSRIMSTHSCKTALESKAGLDEM